MKVGTMQAIPSDDQLAAELRHLATESPLGPSRISVEDAMAEGARRRRVAFWLRITSWRRVCSVRSKN